MVFLSNRSERGTPVLLARELVSLRYPEFADYEAWRALRLESRSFLEPWEPQWDERDLTRASFRRRVRRYARFVQNDEAYPFFIFARDTETLIGAVTLSNVRRGVAQMASLGYWLGEAFTGRGFMTAAVDRVCRFAFEEVHLHRIEAACIPDNVASSAVLERCGFRPEGLARQYLRINGRWHDHRVYARLNDDPAPA